MKTALSLLPVIFYYTEALDLRRLYDQLNKREEARGMYEIANGHGRVFMSDLGKFMTALGRSKTEESIALQQSLKFRG